MAHYARRTKGDRPGERAGVRGGLGSQKPLCRLRVVVTSGAGKMCRRGPLVKRWGGG